MQVVLFQHAHDQGIICATHIHAHTTYHTHTRTHTHTHTMFMLHAHTNTRQSIHPHTYTCTHTCTHRTHAHIHTCTHIYTHHTCTHMDPTINITQEKTDYGALIQELHGEYMDVDYFTASCTHLVVGELHLGSSLRVPLLLKRPFFRESKSHGEVSRGVCVWQMGSSQVLHGSLQSGWEVCGGELVSP